MITITTTSLSQNVYVEKIRSPGAPDFSNSTETRDLGGSTYSFRAPLLTSESLLCKDQEDKYSHHISYSGNEVTIEGLLKPQEALCDGLLDHCIFEIITMSTIFNEHP